MFRKNTSGIMPQVKEKPICKDEYIIIINDVRVYTDSQKIAKKPEYEPIDLGEFYPGICF